MGVYGFILSNFVVSFISDIILNDLTHKRLDEYKYLNKIRTLRPYFKNKFVVEAGVYAALTIVLALIPVSVTTYLLNKTLYPKNIKQLKIYCFIAFIYGYIIDILIDVLKLFGNSLDLYYKEVGKGLWGAIAFLVSIIISYLLNNYLIPLL